MAWKDWRDEVPKVSVQFRCCDLKRRASGQKHVLFRLVDPMIVTREDTGETLDLAAGFLSDGSSVPGALWGGLTAEPADLLLPGFAHDYAYRRGAAWTKPNGTRRALDRYQADLVHIAVCRRLRVRKSDQEKIFFALRVAGGFAYRRRDLGWDGSD
jgi:hypothetical protein